MKSRPSGARKRDPRPRGTKREERGSITASRVFIVEDHPVFRAALVQVIGGEKDLAVCGVASDADGAFDAIGRARPDLVLADIGLPGRGGLELVKDLRAVDRRIKLLVVSMHDAALYADRALQAGANGYVQKQQASEELIQAMRDVLGGQSYVSEDARRVA